MSYYAPMFPTTYAPAYSGYAAQMPMQQAQRPVMQPQQPMSSYICRPVASEEEARAVPTDFTGATTVMVDAAHGCIYTKALNTMDGSAMFATYRYTEPVPPVQEKTQAYAPMEELEQLRREVAELRASMQSEGGRIA